jgi:microcystin-dependent protein
MSKTVFVDGDPSQGIVGTKVTATFLNALNNHRHLGLDEDGDGGQVIPAGAVMGFTTETPPDGWLECDGSSLSRASYATLFAALGTLYGAADGAHFTLPDYRGRFLRGWAHGSANDPDRASRTAPSATGATISAGDHVGTEQTDEFEAHTHTAGPAPQSNNFQTGPSENHWRLDSTTPGTSSSTGGNETRPVNTNVMFCIKY